MAGKLNDRIAVITGGTTGIGFATAQSFVAEGAKVIITGTNPDTLGTAKAKLGASIIATTSVVNRIGMANSSAYAATKAALAQLVKVAATELAPRGIRVNAVSPGPIETPIFDKMDMPEADREQMAQGIASQVALGRFGRAEEVANVVLFLASDDSSFVHGQEFAVDGGMTS